MTSPAWPDGRLPSVRVEAEVDAPPERVWRLITDPDLPARFSTEFQSGIWEDPDRGAAPGAVFIGTNRNESMGEWHVRCLVTVFEPHRTYGWVVGVPDDPAATWTFDLQPAPGDRTVLGYRAVLGPGPSGLTAAFERYPGNEARIVANRIADLRENMTATLAGIADLAAPGPD